MLKSARADRVSRASQPGSRGTRKTSARYAWLVLLGAVAVAAAAAGLSLTRSSGGDAAARYGGVPTWLPSSSVSVGRVAQASPARPWLAVEGDQVRVDLPASQVLATAVGPAVPEEGRFPVPPTSPCTFTVTVTGVSGSTPVRPAAFTIRDELGHLHHPKVTGPGGRPPAGGTAPGRTVTVTVTAVLPTGNGQLQWAPQGGQPVVSWDFDVEID